LGEQAHSLQKLVVDLDMLCPVACRCDGVGYPGYFDALPGQAGWIEVHSLLQVIWDRGLDLQVEFVQPRGKAYRDFINNGRGELARYYHTSQGNDYNVTAMTQILNALIRDELGIRKYGRLLGDVEIKSYRSC
jgi:hypothetical protein